eukprot:7820898-Pyramimonas_sp.AAC.1
MSCHSYCGAHARETMDAHIFQREVELRSPGCRPQRRHMDEALHNLEPERAQRMTSRTTTLRSAKGAGR